MATLTAVKFPTPQGADNALATLQQLQEQQQQATQLRARRQEIEKSAQDFQRQIQQRESQIAAECEYESSEQYSRKAYSPLPRFCGCQLERPIMVQDAA